MPPCPEPPHPSCEAAKPWSPPDPPAPTCAPGDSPRTPRRSRHAWGALVRPCTDGHDHAQYSVAARLALGGGRAPCPVAAVAGSDRFPSSSGPVPCRRARPATDRQRGGSAPRHERSGWGRCAERVGLAGSDGILPEPSVQAVKVRPVGCLWVGQDDQPVGLGQAARVAAFEAAQLVVLRRRTSAGRPTSPTGTLPTGPTWRS